MERLKPQLRFALEKTGRPHLYLVMIAMAASLMITFTLRAIVNAIFFRHLA
jgi:hypothetical protein